MKAVSPINIALVKYWGKVDEEKIIPANSSLSITIDSEHMATTTTVSLLSEQGPPTLELNGVTAEVSSRIQNVISMVRQLVMQNLAKLELRFKVSEFEYFDISQS